MARFLDTLVTQAHQSFSRYPEPLEYLSSRKITKEDVSTYKIGYSKILRLIDDGSEDFKNFMVESGKGKYFENKLIFPLLNPIGQAVGIIGRSLTKKYYCKFFTEEAKACGCFFGLYTALPHIYRSKKAFLTEGVFDHITFSKTFPNSTCVLTATINDNQYDLLSLYAESFTAVFDSDKVGEKGYLTAKEKWPNIDRLNLGFKDPNQALNYLSPDQLKKYVEGKVLSL